MPDNMQVAYCKIYNPWGGGEGGILVQTFFVRRVRVKLGGIAISDLDKKMR